MTNWIRGFAVVAVVALVALVSCGDNTDGPPDAPPRPECHDGHDNDGDRLIDFPEDPGCASLTSDHEDAPLRPQCSNNRDDDDDGRKDFPEDPGCIVPESDDERDDCPDDPACPMCSNGIDDDGNGMQDYPGDPGCDFAADDFEYAGSSQACGNGLKLEQLPLSGTVRGTFSSMSVSNISTPCGGGGRAPAFGYVIVLTRPAVVVISTAGSLVDTVLALRARPCPTGGLACHDNVSSTDTSSRITRSLGVGVYYVIVGTKTPTTVGDYRLTVRQLPGEGESCMKQGDCGPGLVCRVPAGGTQQVCARPVCSDGLDDDADGKIDHPDDPGCDTPADGDEVDDCPGGPSCPACADGVDNDNDTTTDYPMDMSCKAAGDASEECTTSESIAVITQGSISGDTTTAVDDHDPSCNSSTGQANDLLYRIDLPKMQTLTLNVTGFDTVHTLLDSRCGGTPIACSDPPLMTVDDLDAGTYYVSVDGWSTGDGSFTLATGGTIAPGGSCEGVLYQNGAITCPAGFLCDGPPGDRRCITQCTDGIDNNGDGKIDYPTDPGCAAQSDDAEDTVCPGPLCPVCADGADNDADTRIDYPADTSCLAASGASERCPVSEPTGTITGAVTTGTTAGTTNDFDPTCNSATGVAPDVVYQIDLPAMATLSLDVTGYDTVHALLDSSCKTSLACSDPQLMIVSNLAAGTYFVAIDAASTASGPFTLTTSGQIAPGGSCEGALFQNGTLTCQPEAVCGGAVGARTCRTECADGLDNNGDGTIDYPFDPGCTTPGDNTETTVCPGAACPACADGVDNDGDTAIDYPADPQCVAAGVASESCVSTEAIQPITTTVTTGTTVGASNDYKQPICDSTLHTASDLMYQLDVPALQTLTLGLVGFDSVHSLLDSRCSPAPLACSDPALMAVSNLAAGRYYVVVDGWGAASGPFTLTTNGVIVAGESCESPLFTAGALACATGTTCQGPAGARRCVAQCSDGLDNNGDGTIDYPFDPGCSSPTHDTEATVCPGASCPVCGNGSDDDADALTDFPGDFGCHAAAGTSEVFCAVEPSLGGVIGQPTTTGTLAAPAAGDYHQTCQSDTGNDMAFALSLPVPVQTLRIDTTGSSISDTVLSLKDAQCSTQLGCNDDIALGNPLSLLDLSNVPAGNYAIQVDSYSSSGANHGPFKLNVRGTVAPGTACTSPLFASGVLACGSGTICSAGGACE